MNLLLHPDPRVCDRFLSLLGVAASLTSIDEDGDLTLIANNELCRDYLRMGPIRAPVEVTPENMTALLDGPRDPAEVEAYILRMKQNHGQVAWTGRPLNTETEVSWPDGSIRWARNTPTPLHDDERVARILVTFIDVTELRDWQEQLESSLTALIAQAVTVCRDCERVEEDGAWWTMGEYMQRHGNLEFSHGICRRCLERYFGAYRRNR